MKFQSTIAATLLSLPLSAEPDRARTVIKQRAALNPSARLLLELASRLGSAPHPSQP